ncbi:MAG TPA: GNAT family N-acetyltransferase [Longimicrobium sp.]|jgi:RimJ/RimL family protein N-acetyltransferase
MSQLAIVTPDLVLRPFTMDDARAVQRLAGDPAVSDTALDVPYPFEDGMAEAWIGGHAAGFAAGTMAAFAATIPGSGELCGAAGLTIDPEHRRGELGYWIGRPFWGRGYATRAAAVVLEFGFREMKLRRIYATHLTRNLASARVLEKLGMRPEGILRQHVLHRGRWEDLAIRGCLAADRTAGLFKDSSASVQSGSPPEPHIPPVDDGPRCGARAGG